MAQSQGVFSPTNNVEVEMYGFDFVNDLPASDSVASVDIVGLSVVKGTDNDPGSHITGSPIISGTKVTQQLSTLVSGVTYSFTIVINTTLGSVIDLWNYIICVPIPPNT